MLTLFWLEILKGRDSLEDLGDNIRMDVTEVWWEFVDWMHLLQESDQWQALMNTVMNHRVP
jgi:hypothetical protein